jgi:hypothetical protein
MTVPHDEKKSAAPRGVVCSAAKSEKGLKIELLQARTTIR